jgi:hypothetical protein
MTDTESAQGLPAWHWAVGVTTAPRREPTLARTLESLESAGWRSIRLFAEPGLALTDEFGQLTVSARDQRLGAFANFYLGLAELVLRQPLAAAYMMCQDDVVFTAGLRPYLEQSLWPAGDIGVVSVYCPAHAAVGFAFGFHREDRGWQACGAHCYVFPPRSARRFLTSIEVLEHRISGPAQGERNIDSVVGRWCHDRGLDYLVHRPSLAQHIGATSTLYPTARNVGRRAADDFLEKFPT